MSEKFSCNKVKRGFFDNWSKIVLLSVGVGLVTVFLYWRKYRWVKVGTVEELYLYPLKAGAALPVPDFDCFVLGPRHENILDRGFIVGTVEVEEKRMQQLFIELSIIGCGH